MRKFYLFILAFSFSFGLSFAQEGTEGAPVTIEISSKYLSPKQEYTLSGQTETGNKSLSVTIEILSGSSVLETESVSTEITGKYKITRKAPADNGIYQAKVTGADGKISETLSFVVVSPVGASKALAKHFDKPLQLAQKGLETANVIVSSLPPSAAREEFKEKSEEIRQKLLVANERVDALKTEFVKLMEAATEHPSVLEEADKCIGELDGLMEEMRLEAERFSWQVSQKSQEAASNCDNLDFIIETLGYVSKLTSIASSVTETIVGFAKGEAISRTIDAAVTNDDLNFLANATVNAAMSVGDPVGAIIGFTFDLAAYCYKKMYKICCQEMKGPFTGRFYAEFQAGEGKGVWEKYSLAMKGELRLRYGRGGNSKTGFAVTGEFEGTYSDYDFWADVRKVEPLPKDIFLIDTKVLNPISSYVPGERRDGWTLGRIAPLVPGNFRIKVKGVVKDDKLLLKFDDEALVNQVTNANEFFQLIVIAGNPIVPIPLIKRFTFPVAPARSIFIVAMGNEGIELELETINGKTGAKKKVKNERQISNNEIHLKTSLDITVQTQDSDD